jgi:acyl carrier protein
MNTRDQVSEIIGRQLAVPVAELTPEVHFRSLPNVDSMRVLQIILETEKTFDIEISDEVTFRLETIGNYQDLVEELCQQGASA